MSVSSTGQHSNNNSYQPTISADGRYVAFGSLASNLVAGDTNGMGDVFVRDRKRGTTRRVSVSPSRQPANGYSDDPALSADGRYIAFTSDASNLVPADTHHLEDTFIHGPLP